MVGAVQGSVCRWRCSAPDVLLARISHTFAITFIIFILSLYLFLYSSLSPTNFSLSLSLSCSSRNAITIRKALRKNLNILSSWEGSPSCCGKIECFVAVKIGNMISRRTETTVKWIWKFELMRQCRGGGEGVKKVGDENHECKVYYLKGCRRVRNSSLVSLAGSWERTSSLSQTPFNIHILLDGAAFNTRRLRIPWYIVRLLALIWCEWGSPSLYVGRIAARIHP